MFELLIESHSTAMKYSKDLILAQLIDSFPTMALFVSFLYPLLYIFMGTIIWRARIL